MKCNLLRTAALPALALIAAAAPAHAQTITAVSWGIYTDFPYCDDAQNLAGNVSMISVGPAHTLVLGSDGIVRGFGCDSSEFGCAVPSGLANVVAISAHGDHSLALKSDGTIVGWGTDDFGEVVAPAGIGPVTAVATGFYHSVALKQNGQVVTWGLTPATPGDVGTASAIAAGAYHTLALRSNGTVRAWGEFNPAQPPAGLVATAIAAGASHSMALRGNGTVVCWGGNGAGQSNPPAGLANVVKIAAGWDHSVALTADGQVRTWGYTAGGAVPTNLPPAVKIAAGGSQTYAFVGFRDCDASGTHDYCDVADGVQDCNGNGIPDSCDIANGAPDCDGNGVIDSCDADFGGVDCDGNGVVDSCEADCNQNGVPDAADIAAGTAADLNGNGVIDACDDPATFFCGGAGPTPVDLLLVVDRSGSMKDIGTFCEEVLKPACAALGSSYDLRVTWFNLPNQFGPVACDAGEEQGYVFLQRDFGFYTPTCGIDGVVNFEEDWGLGCAVLCNPYVNDFPDWSPRPGVPIIMPLSDEGPKDGCDTGCCAADDQAIATSIISLARRWAVQVMPVAFRGSAECLFSDDAANTGIMDRLAARTGGSVIDVRTLSLLDPTVNAQLALDLEAQVRAAVAVAPRLACPTADCVGDLNDDGQINSIDLGIILTSWGTGNLQGDANGDGSVDSFDLGIILTAWGPCPG